jgi:hypothetical protein
MDACVKSGKNLIFWLALFRGDSGKARDQLTDALAAAVWTLDLGFLDVRHVDVLGEFHVAVLAVVDVLRHSPPPANMIAPGLVDER